MTLNLSALAKPAFSAELKGIKLYFYGARMSDLTALEATRTAPALDKLRTYLLLTASRDDYVPKVQSARLTEEDLAGWTDADYAAAAALLTEHQHQLFAGGSDEKAPPKRDPGDTAVEHIGKVLDWYIKRHVDGMRDLHDRLTKPWLKLHEMAEAASKEHIGRINFEQQIPRVDLNPLFEQSRRLQDERVQELADARRAADSIEEISKNLIEFVLQFSKARAEQQVEQARQVRYAICTFALALVVAIVGAYFAGASHFQDQRNNATNDDWQEKVMAQLRANSDEAQLREQLRSAVERLRQEVETLKAAAKAAAPVPPLPQAGRSEGSAPSQRSPASSDQR